MSNFSVTYKKKFIDTPEGPMALPQPEGPSTGQQILGAGTGAVKTSLKIGDIVNKQRNAQLARITGDAADPRLKFKATDPAMGVDMPADMFIPSDSEGFYRDMYRPLDKRYQLNPLFQGDERDAANLLRERGFSNQDVERFTGVSFKQNPNVGYGKNVINPYLDTKGGGVGFGRKTFSKNIGGDSLLKNPARITHRTPFGQGPVSLQESIAMRKVKDPGALNMWNKSRGNFAARPSVGVKVDKPLGEMFNVTKSKVKPKFLKGKLRGRLKDAFSLKPGEAQGPGKQILKAFGKTKAKGGSGFFKALFPKLGAKAAGTAATGAAGAAAGAGASGLMAGMGPVGWAMLAGQLLGADKWFKKKTVLGTVFKGIFSDERLKKNIKHVGNSPSGIPIVDFEYKDAMNIPGRYRGVLSRHVPSYARKVHPQYGYDMVDYNRIDVDIKKIS